MRTLLAVFTAKSWLALVAVALSCASAVAVPSSSYIRTDGEIKSDSRSMVFDAAHQHIFAAVQERSRIEVFSSTTHERVATIEVPNPTSIDISPDGTRIAVGTYTRYMYLIDTTTLTVTDRVLAPSLGSLYPENIPSEIVFLSNDKALVALHGYEVDTLIWNLATNAFTYKPMLAYTGFLTRSADYSKVLMGSTVSSGTVAIYDVKSDTFQYTKDSSSSSSYTQAGAVSPDGTQFAVYKVVLGESAGVYLYDTNLNQIGYKNAWQNIAGMTYSNDGRYLYVSGNFDLCAIKVMDTHTMEFVGYVSDGGTCGSTKIQGIDATGTLFGGWGAGVMFFDATSLKSLSLPNPTLAFPYAVNPSTGAAGSTTLTTLLVNYFSNSDIYFGKDKGTITRMQGSLISATAPASSQRGPVDVSLEFANGWSLLAPEAFSYGPYIKALMQNAGSTAGGQSVEIRGYGFGATAPITVTIGEKTATVLSRKTVNPNSGDTVIPEEGVVVSTPPGVPGWADVTVTTPAGSTTLKKGFNYLAKSAVYPRASNMTHPTYDRFRNRVYVSSGTQVEVFDLRTETWMPPLVPPSSTGSSLLRGMALSGDGSQLFVADAGTGRLHVVDPDLGTGYSIDLGTAGYGPTQVVWANGRPYAGMGPDTGGLVYEVDLLSKSYKQLSYGSYTLCGEAYLAASLDGSRMFIAFGGCSAANVFEFDFANGQMLHGEDARGYDAAVSADGNVFATGGGNQGVSFSNPFILDSDLNLRAIPRRDNYDSYGFGLAPGQTLHPSGAYLYEPSPQHLNGPSGPPWQDYIDVIDTHRGNLRHRIILRGDLPDLLSRDTGGRRILTSDDIGKRLFAITGAGLAVLEFSEMPLGTGGVYPSALLPLTGTQLKVRGSGFKNGAVVSINGQSLPATWVDENTLVLTSPELPIGMYSVTVTNPDGESSILPASLRVMAPRPTPVITSVSPVTYVTRETPSQLVVRGSGFYYDSKVRWNGANRDTTFISSSELRSDTQTMDVDAGAVVGITVYTPGLGGGTSNVATVTVANPVPSIQYVQHRIITGSKGFSLTVRGTGVLPVSVVRWNGSDVVTKYDDYYQCLYATITDAMIANPATIALTVFNPGPGGGESAPVAIVIGPPAPYINYPTSLSFAATAGSTQYVYTWVNNSGQGTLTPPQVTITGEFQYQPDFCMTQPIKVSAGCGFNVIFAPKTAGMKYGTLTFVDNTDDSPHVVALTGSASGKKAWMLSPTNLSVLQSSSVAFNWSTGTGASQFWIWIGTTPGGMELYNQGQGMNTSVTVNGLPVNGAPVYLRLFTALGDTWEWTDYTFTAATAAPGKAVMLSPVNGATLPASSASFNWSPSSTASQYWMWIGTTPGGMDLYNHDQGMNTLATVDGLPTDGLPVYARLFSVINGAWQWNDYTYTAVTVPTKATMISPANGSILASSTATFQWAPGIASTQYWIWIGKTAGSSEIYNQGQALNTSATVTNLPVDGSTLYVRLFSVLSGNWQWNDYTYTAATPPGKAAMISPANRAILPSSTATFTWTPGSGATQYWMWIGTTAGGMELYNQGQGLNTSATVNGLPTDGSTIYVRLFTVLNGQWQWNDYTYTATSGVSKAAISTPANGTTLPGSSATFTWAPGSGATQYWMWIGTTPGGMELYNQGQGLNTSATVSNLPIDGSPVYVRLFTVLNGQWQWNDYTYTAAINLSKAEMITPANGATLPGSSVNFQWSAGTGSTQYWMWIGTTPGGMELYNQGQGLQTSVIVSGLPTNGSNVYVRLFSVLNGAWQWNDYAYSAAAQ